MFLIAVSGLDGPEEELARTLAAALGKTPYEMRSRARAPRGGPTVVGTYGDGDAAEAVAAKLRAAGLSVIIDTPEAVTGAWERIVGRRIELDGGVALEDRAGVRYEVPPGDVQVLLSGVGHWTETRTETQTTRQFSAGRAILSGGLMVTRKTTTERVTTAQGGDRFLVVYLARRCYLLRETEMQYTGLGDLMEASRTANFLVVQRELLARCTAAVHDDRLLTRAGQLQVLGPAFPPEDHVELAAALVARTLGAG